MAEIIKAVSSRLKPWGHVVVNIVALENLNTVINTLKANGFLTEVASVNIARSTEIVNMNRLQALNPVFVVSGVFVPEKDS